MHFLVFEHPRFHQYYYHCSEFDPVLQPRIVDAHLSLCLYRYRPIVPVSYSLAEYPPKVRYLNRH